VTGNRIDSYAIGLTIFVRWQSALAALTGVGALAPLLAATMQPAAR
jgi:hypothetical protein